MRAHGARRTLHRLLRGHYRRFGIFLAVGLVGVAISNGGLVALRELGRLDIFLAGCISWEAAVVVTFALNATITWRGATTKSWLRRFVAFELVTLVGLAIYLGTIAVVQGGWHLHYALGGLAGSGIAAVWNYAANHVFTFAREPESTRAAA